MNIIARSAVCWILLIQSPREKSDVFSIHGQFSKKSRSHVQSHFEFSIGKIENFFIGQRWRRPAGGKKGKQQALSPFFKIVLCDLDYHGHKTQMHKVLEIFYLLITSAFKDLTSSKLMLSRFHFNQN